MELDEFNRVHKLISGANSIAHCHNSRRVFWKSVDVFVGDNKQISGISEDLFDRLLYITGRATVPAAVSDDGLRIAGLAVLVLLSVGVLNRSGGSGGG